MWIGRCPRILKSNAGCNIKTAGCAPGTRRFLIVRAWLGFSPGLISERLEGMDYFSSIKEIVGEENVRTDTVDRVCYSRDMSLHEGIPDAVVFARSREEVSRILTQANEKRFPGVAPG